MGGRVSRGHLEYSDERGSYRFPLGRRSRKTLAVLDEKKGEYIRSLELDLFTGFVYYCVDNATSGGLSYYYDMSSKKVGHYFIHRYIRTARNHGFTCSALESEVFEKLPCENWIEEMERLPGWKEAIENRIENLLLPGREVIRIAAAGTVSTGRPAPQEEDGKPAVASINFVQTAAAHPSLKREFVFAIDQSGDRRILRYRNENYGNEFFGENEELDLFLTEKEYAWIMGLAAAVFSDAEEKTAGGKGEDPGTQLLALLPKREELVMEEVCIHYADGTTARKQTSLPLQKRNAEILKAALRGLLRREIELA